MPRKPQQETKRKVTVVIDGSPITVTLTPPTGARRSWYAYWPGLVASKSTGATDPSEAVLVVEGMIRNGGRRSTPDGSILSDHEFEEIQRVNFSRQLDPAARARAQKTLESCLDAIAAFRAITGLVPVTLATPDDCAAFQRKALTLPKNFRLRYPKSKAAVGCYSANNVLKWSRSLQAAFERANRNAPRRKCVRGVVGEAKLLSDNPWHHFPWIEGTRRPIRQFDGEELLSLLDSFEEHYPGVTAATALARVYVWSWGRRLEVAGLRWDALRSVGGERHFESVGKHGVEKWFRIPEAVYEELLGMRTGSPYVFAAFSEQLRGFHDRNGRQRMVRNVAEFDPVNLGNWFYRKVVRWSRSLPKGRASTHIFRKTSLQLARSGEDLNRQVAADARLTESVLTAHYVQETDEQLRHKSNRTYRRILASLPVEVARRLGHVEAEGASLEDRLQAAIVAKDWALVADLSARLAERNPAGLSRAGKRRRRMTGIIPGHPPFLFWSPPCEIL